ncbi:MAG: hypothetical protein ACREHF_13610 [Rhizomicrobium sp.]
MTVPPQFQGGWKGVPELGGFPPPVAGHDFWWPAESFTLRTHAMPVLQNCQNRREFNGLNGSFGGFFGIF